MSQALSIHAIHCTYDKTPVLRGIDLTVSAGEIICLLGASGSGKTTLLRIIAGLAQADSGDIRLGGDSILKIPVHQRDFGLMFQDFALFPHLNVAQNIAFGMRMRRVPAEEQQHRIQQMLALVGLDGFESRDIAQLSGGEQQRVALARSLAAKPRLLLLDEPLGSLDATLRQRLVIELRTIIKQTGITAVYVTHDHQEAFAISDRIAIMHKGQIEQIDTPQHLYHHPKTAYVAGFLGLNNRVPVIKAADDTVQTLFGAFPAPRHTQALLLHPDGIQLHPNDTSVTPPDSISIKGILREAVFLGDAYRLTLQHESGIEITFQHHGAIIPQQGEIVTVQIKHSAILPLTVTED